MPAKPFGLNHKAGLFSTLFLLFLPEMKTIAKLRFIKILALLTGLCGLVSCQDDELCEESTASRLRMGFYLPVVTSGNPTPYTVDSLTVYGVGRPDSLIYDNRKNVRSIEVPLNPTANRTGFVFFFPENITDTLWVDYQTELNFISAECGFAMFFDIEQVGHTNNRISFFQINQNLVTNSLEEHIKILLYPDPDL